MLGAVGRKARELWRKATRRSPFYPEERAAKAERARQARQARQETQAWDPHHHTPPSSGF